MSYREFCGREGIRTPGLLGANYLYEETAVRDEVEESNHGIESSVWLTLTREMESAQLNVRQSDFQVK